jgi:hypothetical protein
MPQQHERRWPRITVGYALLFLIVAALTAFFHDFVAPENRPLVIRLATAFVAAVAIIHLRVYFRGDPRWEPPSAFEESLIRQPAVPRFDASFVRLREEVANGAASRSYFDKILWPRLTALSKSRGQDELPIPAGRRLGRGPSRRSIAALLDRIEGRV